MSNEKSNKTHYLIFHVLCSFNQYRPLLIYAYHYLPMLIIYLHINKIDYHTGMILVFNLSYEFVAGQYLQHRTALVGGAVMGAW